MFYHYRQNNTGGSFVSDDNLTTNVIIEADSPRAANDKLEDLGGYFDGCDDGRDCPCCGDRWYRADKYDESENPEVYGVHPKDIKNLKGHLAWNDPDVIVHYKDGRKETY